MNLINHTFKFRKAGEWQDVSTIELFRDKKVIVFGLPGAFTPTCSSQQLPGFEKEYNSINNWRRSIKIALEDANNDLRIN